MLRFQYIKFLRFPSTSVYYREKGKKTGKKFLSSQNHSNQKPSNHAGFALKIAM